jgi:YD repeat-containing protein
LNRVTKVTDALGGVATTVYDAVGNVTQRVDQLGHTTTYTYRSSAATKKAADGGMRLSLAA